jgi:hypothetical protein
VTKSRRGFAGKTPARREFRRDDAKRLRANAKFRPPRAMRPFVAGFAMPAIYGFAGYADNLARTAVDPNPVARRGV